MPESLLAMLIGTSLTSLVAYLIWNRGHHADRRSRKTNEVGAYCVWCRYRHGEICTHPGSPVYLAGCGPVCTGTRRCEVGQERQRW